MEQPRVLANTLAQYVGPGYRLKMGRPPLDEDGIRRISRVYLTACGTSYHAALTARYLLEELACVPAVVEQASECGLHQQLVGPSTLAVAVSQSGRSRETLNALEAARRKGAATLALVNDATSPLARAADGCLTTLAGRVLAHSSTKAFTTQSLVLALMAFRIARARGLMRDTYLEEIQALGRIGETVRGTLAKCRGQVEPLARLLNAHSHLFILAKGSLLPMVYEGALKLKEIARLHAEGYSAGEFGHGPLALAGPDTPVALMAFSDARYEAAAFKDLARSLRSRRVPLVLFAEDGPRKDVELLTMADCAVLLPPAPPRLRPLTAILPFQLLACALGQMKGLDVDRPGGLLNGSRVPDENGGHPDLPAGSPSGAARGALDS
ncbi:MAG: SIS domain-containing protein [Deltaproteobacteria bacterium]|nr:SIS domain-containing protein [Deltaproteobacteria bacterium]